ncbi:hypothetical protein BJ508DRAFT_151532 [Ascobolus immersus RN42]|uniref:Uncharacterized protein n=1 Tax=Ascobolus immersus RN42 TaxID=1160509 RepID=A0A3N4HY89_ASCIM|nr:hypothetical protein BJ508DRAFT_151532 [Ascobolus immersus RN42]
MPCIQLNSLPITLSLQLMSSFNLGSRSVITTSRRIRTITKLTHDLPIQLHLTTPTPTSPPPPPQNHHNTHQDSNKHPHPNTNPNTNLPPHRNTPLRLFRRRTQHRRTRLTRHSPCRR